MVHYVEKGSIGDGQRIRRMDMLLSVNGKPVRTLKQLYRILDHAYQKKTQVKIKFIRIGNIHGELFSYLVRPLTVDKPRYIGDSKVPTP